MFAASRLGVPGRIDNNSIAGIARDGRARSPLRAAIPWRSRSDRPTTYHIGCRSGCAKDSAHYSIRAAKSVFLWLHHGFVRIIR